MTVTYLIPVTIYFNFVQYKIFAITNIVRASRKGVRGEIYEISNKLKHIKVTKNRKVNARSEALREQAWSEYNQ